MISRNPSTSLWWTVITLRDPFKELILIVSALRNSFCAGRVAKIN